MVRRLGKEPRRKKRQGNANLNLGGNEYQDVPYVRRLGGWEIPKKDLDIQLENKC